MKSHQQPGAGFLATLRAAFAAWLDAHTDAELARVLGADRAAEVRS